MRGSPRISDTGRTLWQQPPSHSATQDCCSRAKTRDIATFLYLMSATNRDRTVCSRPTTSSPPPHLHVFPQVGGLPQQRGSHLEDVVHSPDAQVPQSRVVPSLSGLSHRQSPFVRLSPSSPVGHGYVDKQPGVRKLLPRQRLERHVSVTRLKTLQGDGVLTCGMCGSRS